MRTLESIITLFACIMLFSCETNSEIEYPESGNHGINILDKNKTSYSAGIYSLNAHLPKKANLKVKISGLNYYFPTPQNNTGWEYSLFDETDNSRTFTSVKTGKIDFKIQFEYIEDNPLLNVTDITVFENGSDEATWTKQITVY